MQDLLFSKFSSEKFTSAHRLLRKNGFNHVICAENIADKHFKIFFVCSDKANARLGIIVGKKTIPCANKRNRLKRIIRETFRHHSISLCKIDIVVMVRRAYLKELNSQTSDLRMLLSRVENKCVVF